MATILLSQPLGTLLGQLLTPLIVTNVESVSIMNIIWFVPAGLGAILALWKVNSDVPPTPPSPSAAKAMNETSTKFNDYWKIVKKLFSNRSFVVGFFYIGGIFAFIPTINTKIEHFACSRGYSDQIAGLSGSLILIAGFIMSFPIGMIAYRTKRPLVVCKICA